MRNKLLNSIVILISVFIFLSIFIFSNGLSSLVNIFKTLNMKWIIFGVLCMLIFWMLETIILYIIIKIPNKENGLFIKALKIAMIGQFFSAVTPLQSGGQPAQLYAMKENGLPGDCSGSILMVKFIIHQATFILYSILVFLTEYNFFNSKISYFLPFCIFGLIVNIIILLGLVFSVSKRMANNKTISRVILFIIKLFNKLKIIKNSNTTLSELKAKLISFQECAAFIKENVRICVYSTILTFIQWTVFYTIPYCIYRSFGYNSANILTMIAAQVFLTLFMSFIPLPGAAGGAEGGFFIIFGIFFKASLIVPAIFIWRVITYYSTIAIGSLFTLLPTGRSVKK
jgi:glycosyltransferase 2 family protein